MPQGHSPAAGRNALALLELALGAGPILVHLAHACRPRDSRYGEDNDAEAQSALAKYLHALPVFDPCGSAPSEPAAAHSRTEILGPRVWRHRQAKAQLCW